MGGGGALGQASGHPAEAGNAYASWKSQHLWGDIAFSGDIAGDREGGSPASLFLQLWPHQRCLDWRRDPGDLTWGIGQSRARVQRYNPNAIAPTAEAGSFANVAE